MVQPYYVVTKKDDVHIYLCTWKDVFNNIYEKSYKTILGYLLKTLSLYVYLYVYVCMSQRLYAKLSMYFWVERL